MNIFVSTFRKTFFRFFSSSWARTSPSRIIYVPISLAELRSSKKKKNWRAHCNSTNVLLSCDNPINDTSQFFCRFVVSDKSTITVSVDRSLITIHNSSFGEKNWYHYSDYSVFCLTRTEHSNRNALFSKHLKTWNIVIVF